MTIVQYVSSSYITTIMSQPKTVQNSDFDRKRMFELELIAVMNSFTAWMTDNKKVRWHVYNY